MSVAAEWSGRAFRSALKHWRTTSFGLCSSALSFFVLGAALLVVTNVRAFERRCHEAERVSVYLKDAANADDLNELLSVLRRMPEVRDVRYLSAHDARAEFAQGSGEGPELIDLPEGVFPASVEVQIGEGLQGTDVNAFARELSRLRAVESVETYGAFTAEAHKLLRAAVVGAVGLSVLVLLVVVVSVASASRASFSLRRREAQVLELVGATPMYVRGPLLVEGGLLASGGAVLGTLALFAGHLGLKSTFESGSAAWSFLSLPFVLLLWVAFAGVGLSAAAVGARRMPRGAE